MTVTRVDGHKLLNFVSHLDDNTIEQVKQTASPPFVHPHGAGRRYSRTKARELFTSDDLAARMTGIEYRRGDQWVDVIPDAYKDIDVVMDNAVDLVEVEHELRQVLNLKGT